MTHYWTIAQFRYIKIQPKTIDLSTRLVGINPTNSVVIPTSLVLRSIVLGSILIYRNWAIADLFVKQIHSQIPAWCHMWFGVCCWFSPCSEGFSPDIPVFLPPEKPTSPNSHLIRIEDLHESQQGLMWLSLYIFIIYCIYFQIFTVCAVQ